MATSRHCPFIIAIHTVGVIKVFTHELAGEAGCPVYNDVQFAFFRHNILDLIGFLFDWRTFQSHSLGNESSAATPVIPCNSKQTLHSNHHTN